MAQYPVVKIIKPVPAPEVGVVEIHEDNLVVAKQSLQVWSIGSGVLDKRAYLLPDDLDWVIVRDGQNRICLVPLKKEVKS